MDANIKNKLYICKLNKEKFGVMAKKSNWNDDYWLLVVQLYLRKPVGVKPVYGKLVIDLCSEIHVSPMEMHAKMEAIDKLQTPRIERLWRTYSGSPAKLRRAVELLRQMKGFGSNGDFYDGVEMNETFERDFRPLAEDDQLTPVKLILILDLYFRLTTLTMVPETPEVVELSRLMRIKPQKTAEALNVFQYCDPYLNRQDIIFSPLLGPCEEVWSRCADMSPEQLADYADQLKEYFKS